MVSPGRIIDRWGLVVSNSGVLRYFCTAKTKKYFTKSG